MAFSLTKGFASLNYDDTIARSTYIDQLPMIAECLSFQHFMNELEIVEKSILQYPDLVQKLIKIFPQILQYFDNEQKYQVIYASGKNLPFSSSDKTEKELLEVLEKVLQEMNDITHEFETYIQPTLIPKPDEFCMIEKFPLWRLARLTVLCKDYSPFENLIYKLFSENDNTISAASDVLYLMHPDIVKKYLIKALMSPNENNRIAAIRAIEVHNIDTNEEAIAALIKNEKNARVLSKISELPPKLITKDIMELLINEETTSKKGRALCLSSPYFEEFLPLLKKKKGVGCEINNANFTIISQCNPIPYDFLSMLIRESKELISEKTIESIIKLDKAQVMSNLILPRINEKGNWRSRYNSVMITTKLLQNSLNGVDPLDQVFVQNFAGFTVAMSLDNVYAVREAAYKTLCLYPQSNATSIIESLTSIVTEQTEDFQKQILREFFTTAHSTIAKYSDRNKLESVMKMINFNDPSFFDVVNK